MSLLGDLITRMVGNHNPNYETNTSTKNVSAVLVGIVYSVLSVNFGEHRGKIYSYITHLYG